MNEQHTFVPRIIGRKGALLAVDKPSGMLVHNSAFAGPPERSLTEALREACGHEVWPLHRLDRGTSGVLLFCENPEEKRTAMERVHEHAREKRYLAVVRGYLEDVGEVTRPVPDEKGVRREARSIVRGFGRSESHYLSLAGAEILTGRRHQVRRHLRSCRCPVLGDATWGNSRFNREIKAATGFDRLALHAASITIPVEHEQSWRVSVAPTGQLDELIRAAFPEDVRARAYEWAGLTEYS